MSEGTPSLQLQLQLGEVSGEGTSGTVSHVAGAVDGGRYVAKRAKVAGPDARAMLANEIRLHRLCSERCSEIVRYVFASETAEEVVVLMEACDTILWEALTAGPAWHSLAGFNHPSSADRQAWTLQLCAGVRHCHSLRVLHRDINPWNVFLVRIGGPSDGSAKAAARLGDFGLAVEIPEGNDMQLSGVEAQLGAMALDESALGSLYSAPELGSSAYSLPADVFSLGMTVLAIWASGEVACDESALVQITEDVKLASGQSDPVLPTLAVADPDIQSLIFSLVAGSPGARPSASHALEQMEKPRKAGPEVSTTCPSSPRSGKVKCSPFSKSCSLM